LLPIINGQLITTVNASENAGEDNYFDDSTFSNTVFGVGDDQFGPNVNGTTMVAYCFHSVDSFSKIGSYTGNGSDNGPIVETGFEPAFVMIKRSSGTGNWQIWDNKRSTTNTRDKLLFPNDSAAEQTLAYVDFLSNGFQIVDASGATGGTNVNINGSTYIYMAFAADPDTEAPTVAKSFSTVTYTGTNATNSITGLGFKPNLVWIKDRNNAEQHILNDSVRGASNDLSTDRSTEERTRTTGFLSFDSDGFTLGTDGSGVVNDSIRGPYVAWAWKADDNEPTIYGGSALAVYKFEDNANDVRGNYNGTTSNITYTTGKFNKAASFVVGNSSEIDFSNSLHGSSFSMSFWMKATDMGTGTTATGYSIYSAYVDVNNYFRPVLYGDGSLLLLSKYSGTFKSNSTSSGIITENTWHHIVFNFTPTDTKAYVDGVNVGTFPSYDPISFTAKAFGTNRGNPDFTGDIDQLRFYDAALTQENVTALYEETTSDNDDLTLGAPGEVVISANSNAGFSIVKYEGDGVADQQVPHGLSAAPEMIIIKNLDDTDKWAVYHTGVGPTKFLSLNESAAAVTSSAYWNNTAPTSTVFTLGATSPVNSPNNENYIAYCFHSVAGYSKFGSYTGNGSAGHAITGLGFQPDFILIKGITSADNWFIFDSVRGDSVTVNANLSAAEYADTGVTSFDTGGFTLGSGAGENRNGDTYIYMAFKIN